MFANVFGFLLRAGGSSDSQVLGLPGRAAVGCCGRLVPQRSDGRVLEAATSASESLLMRACAAPCCPARRSNDLDVINSEDDHAADLLVLVELTGFEPLTPSMRTERAAQQNPSCSTLPQVSGRFLEPDHRV